MSETSPKGSAFIASFFNGTDVRKYVSYIRACLVRDDWRRTGKCDVLLVGHDHNCGFTYQGRAYPHLLGSLGYLFERRGLKISAVATPLSRLVGDRAHYSPVSFNQRVTFILLFRFVMTATSGAEAAEEWTKRHYVALWKGLLANARPKTIIGIHPDKYACLAAREMKVPIYDLQHGVITDDHHWYGHRFMDHAPSDELPDGFLCWDEHSAGVISKWAGKLGKDVRVIGNPWFLRFLRQDPEDELVQEALKEQAVHRGGRPSILVTLQWTLLKKGDSRDGDYLPPPLVELIKDTINIYEWNIRLHPLQLRSVELGIVTKYLEDRFGKDIVNNWIERSEVPLPIVLSGTDLHITKFSTVVIEAAWMGIPSAIIEGSISQYYYELERSKGIAEVVTPDYAALKRWIEDRSQKGRDRPVLSNMTYELDQFVDEVSYGRLRPIP